MKSLQNMGSMFGSLLMSKMRGVVSWPQPLFWLLLFQVKCQGWQHHLWVHVGDMLCLNVVNAPNDYKVCVDLTSISIKETNSLCKKQSNGPRKVGRVDKNGTMHVLVLACPHGSSTHQWKINFLFESFCSKKLSHSSTPSTFAIKVINTSSP